MIVENINTVEQNSTFNLENLENTIQEIKQTSFQNLNEFQKTLTGIKRFDFTMNDLKLVTNLDNKKIRKYPKKYVYSIEDDFINKKKRLLYRRSAFFNKELTIFDTANNPNIFSSTFLVFIDGKFIDSINIIAKEENTLVVVDVQDTMNSTGIPKDHFKTLQNNNAKITVLIIPNCAYGVYKTNINVLNSYKDNLELSRFNIVNNLSTDTKYITFINTNNLLFSSVITDTTNSAEMLRFYSNGSLPTTSKIVHLNVFGFRHLHDQIDLPANEKFFQINGLNMPVPVENFIVFRNQANNTKVFAHDITIKQYFPNVYEVVGNTNNDKLTIYTFYSNDITDSPLEYKNDLETYMKYKNNFLNDYKNGLTPDIIKNYIAPSYVYDINDFRASADNPNHLAYKLRKFSEWVDNNPELMKLYLDNQIQTTTGYYIEVALLDLPSKVRTHNRDEVENEFLQETFSEQRYLFVLKNEFGTGFQHLRFYIDGEAYVPDKKWKNNLYEFYYIPTTLIKSDTIIEIEKFEPLNYIEDIKLTSTSINKTIKIDYEGYISRNDIFVIKKSTKEFIDKSKYKISYINDNNVKVDLGTDSFKMIPNNEFVINITDSSLANVDLTVYVQRETRYSNYKITEPDSIGNSFEFSFEVNPDPRNFRIFRNKRLLAQDLYEIVPAKTLGGKTFVTPLVIKEIGDEYIIDYTPNKYKLIYQEKIIDSKGLINLAGKVNKPFDLKWFDMYLNGKRITKNNLEILSPYLLFVKGIKTLKNLIIVERDKDNDFITPSSSARTLTDRIWSSVESFRTTVLGTKSTIVDTEVDVISEIITAKSLMLKRFYDEVINTFTIINPGLNQITDEQKNAYPELFKGNVLLLNPGEDLTSRSYIMKVGTFK